jgi:hypothetical protein
MKRPFVAVVSCYAIGLLLAGIFQPPLVALFGRLCSFFILACRAEASARRRVLVLEKLRPWLIWPLLALAGWTNLASRTAIVSPNDLRALLGDTNAIVTVRGTLIETPHCASPNATAGKPNARSHKSGSPRCAATQTGSRLPVQSS